MSISQFACARLHCLHEENVERLTSVACRETKYCYIGGAGGGGATAEGAASGAATKCACISNLEAKILDKTDASLIF